MLRRLAHFAFFTVLFASPGCTASDPALGQKGQGCDEDLQCAKPFICACVEIRGTGDDGNDEVVKHGTCQLAGFKCVKDDAGGDAPKFDTAPVDAPKLDTAPVDAPTLDSAADAEASTDATSGDDSDAGGG